MILTVNVSALRINEIEANPDGEDSGFEWVELYSENSVNLEGYTLDHEGRGAQINLSGNFQGFFIISLQTQWLRNTNETVYLKLNNQIVETIGPFNDNKVDKTYSLCDSEWEFMSSTKNGENLCGTPQTQTSTNDNLDMEKGEHIVVEEKTKNNEIVKNNNSTTKEFVELTETKTSKISLNQENNEQKYEITRTYKARNAVIYFFIGFCVLLVILIALKKI